MITDNKQLKNIRIIAATPATFETQTGGVSVWYDDDMAEIVTNAVKMAEQLEIAKKLAEAAHIVLVERMSSGRSDQVVVAMKDINNLRDALRIFENIINHIS